MSEPGETGLPPDVEALLGHERRVPELEGRVHARMKARLRGAIGGGPEGGETPPTGGTGGGSPMAPLGAWGFAAGLVLGGVLGAAGMWGWLANDAAEPSTLARAMEAPAAVGGRAVVSDDDSGAIEVPEAERVAAAVDAGAPRAGDAPEPSVRGIPRRARRPRESPPDTLAEERRILDSASASIRNRHTDEGMRALDRHEHTFPSGALVEEREGLRVRALIEAGRLDEAKARARAFHAAYPRSLLWNGLRVRLERARAAR